MLDEIVMQTIKGVLRTLFLEFVGIPIYYFVIVVPPLWLTRRPRRFIREHVGRLRIAQDTNYVDYVLAGQFTGCRFKRSGQRHQG